MNKGIKDLRSFALPLGYVAIYIKFGGGEGTLLSYISIGADYIFNLSGKGTHPMDAFLCTWGMSPINKLSGVLWKLKILGISNNTSILVLPINLT